MNREQALRMTRFGWLLGLVLIVSSVESAADDWNRLRADFVDSDERLLLASPKIVSTGRRGARQPGTGIYLDRNRNDAFLLTAFHVIAGARSIAVYWHGDNEGSQKAEFVDGDEDLDIAVIKVPFVRRGVMERLVPFRIGRAEDVGELRNDKLGVVVILRDTPAAGRESGPSLDGATVAVVAPGSPGDLGGLIRGDLILAVNDRSISGAQDLLDKIAALPTNTAYTLRVWRDGQTRTLAIPAQHAFGGKVSFVHSVGHAEGQDWSSRSGAILMRRDDGHLWISPRLSEPGISGGPLISSDWRLLGVVLQKGEAYSTALRIERALDKVEAWNVNYRRWLTAEFCSDLEAVVRARKGKFADLRLGPAHAGARNKWRANIDVLGHGNSFVEKVSSHVYSSEIAGSVGQVYSEQLFAEIANSIKRCFPKAYYHRSKYGMKVSFELPGDGFFTGVREVWLYKFASLFLLRVE